MDRLDLRTLRVKNRIPLKTIAEIMGLSHSQISRRETGGVPFSEQEKAMYLQAVDMCTSGKYPYTPVTRRCFTIAERFSSDNYCTAPQCERLREKILSLNLPRAELAAMANVSLSTIHFIMSGRVVKIPLFNRVAQTVNNLIAQRETDTPATVEQPPVIPAKSEQPEVLTPKQDTPNPAKSEHIHYTSCRLQQVRFVKDMLRALAIPREAASRNTGIPLQFLTAKLDGDLPMFQPEYEALISYIYSQHSNTSRQKTIQFS